MKPAAFEYDDPSTVDEVLDLLARHGDECKVLAGGQSLVPLMNFRLARPARLVDINGVASLAHLGRAGDGLAIGALTRHAELERSTVVAEGWPLLAEAVAWVGHPQVRNRGTAGGSVAHADPAAELPAVFAALEASFHLKSRRGDRTLRWDEMFRSEFTTALEPDELLVRMDVPEVEPGEGSAFIEFARRHGDFALGGAAVRLRLDASGRCESAKIALVAAGPRPVRATAAEAQLKGEAIDEAAIAAAAGRSVEGLRPTADLHGSSEYRLQLLRVMVQRALTRAAERARSNVA